MWRLAVRQDLLRSDQVAAPGIVGQPDRLADRPGAVDAESRILRLARRGSLGAMTWVIGSWIVAFVIIAVVISALR
jgi:hypothetical protein